MKPFTLIYLFFILFSSCSDVDDLYEENGSPDGLYFPAIEGDAWDTVSLQDLEWNESQLMPLLDFLEEEETKTFIILKDGKIAVEWYGNDFTKNDLWYWASAGKVLTATVIGIAEQEGFLSRNDKTSDYLGEGWTNASIEEENRITILNQLTMTSGLNSSIFDCTKPECLLFVENASERWAYHNAPYTLLQKIVESAANVNFESYFNEKLKNKIGMNGVWASTNGFNHVYFSSGRSMARFGLLMLNKGRWNEEIILNQEYFMDMVNTSQNINKSYGYLWWLNGKSNYMLPQGQTVFDGFLVPNAPSDMIAGLGKNDQKIYVVPSQNLVIIRMGEISGADSLVPIAFDDVLWEKINLLIN